MKKIYVWCSLTHATPEFRESIGQFKDSLRNNFEVLDFFGLENGDARDVFEYNRNCVLSSDIIIAECSNPSTGLWYELALAIEAGKLTIILFHEEAKVTRMVLGIPEEKATFIKYKNLNEVLDQINKLQFVQ